MKQRERVIRLLPLPAKQLAKTVRNAADPLMLQIYRRRTGDQRPFPPARVRARAGAYSINIWAGTGAASATQFAEGLERAGRAFETVASVLDFGCGAGRILPHLMERCRTDVRFAGCDVDRDAVAWAQEHFPRAELKVNNAMPPMPFEDEAFEVVYSNSIFTHLDERVQDAWLPDIHRVLAPGGIALLTTHGEFAYDEFHSGRIVTNTRNCAERVAAHGPLATERFIHEPYVVTAINAGDFPGVDDTFGVAFHDPAYVRDHWSRWFDVIDLMPRQMLELQDLVICRRRD